MMRIVYIEDNPANIALVERICRLNKDQLTTFSHPDQVLAAPPFEAIDLILMDVNLGVPEMNGLELTRHLRAQGVRAPIVIVTAHDASGHPSGFHTIGFNEYVMKPVSVRDMIELINSYRPKAAPSAPATTNS